MKIGTIGTSWITGSFIKSSSYINEVKVTAVCSRTMEKAKEFSDSFGIGECYRSIDDMLSSDIDSVYIASPNVCHFSQIMQCLEHNKNVICEKPVTVTSDQLKKAYELADSKGLILLEAMKSMHSSGLEIVRKELSSLGNIEAAELDFSQLSSKYPAYKRGENPNIFNPEMCAGALMDIGVYAVYAAVEFFGIPKKVKSVCRFLDSGADSSGALIFEYDDKNVTINYSKVANGFIGSRILGENGAITISSLSKLIGIKRFYNDGTVNEIYPEVDENIVMSMEIKAFYDFVNGKNISYYKICRNTSLAVCKILENIRKENNFGF